MYRIRPTLSNRVIINASLFLLSCWTLACFLPQLGCKSVIPGGVPHKGIHDAVRFSVIDEMLWRGFGLGVDVRADKGPDSPERLYETRLAVLLYDNMHGSCWVNVPSWRTYALPFSWLRMHYEGKSVWVSGTSDQERPPTGTESMNICVNIPSNWLEAYLERARQQDATREVLPYVIPFVKQRYKDGKCHVFVGPYVDVSQVVHIYVYDDDSMFLMRFHPYSVRDLASHRVPDNEVTFEEDMNNARNPTDGMTLQMDSVFGFQKNKFLCLSAGTQFVFSGGR